MKLSVGVARRLFVLVARSYLNVPAAKGGATPQKKKEGRAPQTRSLSLSTVASIGFEWPGGQARSEFCELTQSAATSKGIQ